MERIDRLIIKAKKAAQAKAERFTVGFVTYEPDKGQYKACGHLWGNHAPDQERERYALPSLPGTPEENRCCGRCHVGLKGGVL